MKPIKVAITGASGQIGSVIVKHLGFLSDVKSVAICRNSINAGVINFLNPNCEIRIGSITDDESAIKMLSDCDVIINCALAMVSGRPRLSRALNKKMIDNFAHLKYLKMLIHLSSISVYGGCIVSNNTLKEFENPKANNDYGRSKLYIEKYASNICIKRNVKFYMLRLGHVIGARTDRSRQIFDFAADPEFRLPFDGLLPSNTIHVERLGAMIKSLLYEPVPVGTYNVADANNTWRNVYNWHTETVGLKPVQAMSPDRSKRLRAFFASPSILRDVNNWFGSIPFLSLLKYPAVFESAYRVLASVPQSLTDEIAVKYKMKDIARQLRALNKNDDRKLGPVYVSDAMPGKYMVIPQEVIDTAPSKYDMDFTLKDWYMKFSNPRWLPSQLSIL